MNIGRLIMDDREALLPCPFCGSARLSIAVTDVEWVNCEDCRAEGPYRSTEAEAIKAWNTRTIAPPSEDIVEKVARAIHDARYAHPRFPREPEPFTDQSDIEYASRLARAAIAAIQLER